MKPTFAERLGTALRIRRVATGLSQEAFADTFSMHRTYYSAIERGEKNLQIDTLACVCNGLELPMWQVVKAAENGD